MLLSVTTALTCSLSILLLILSWSVIHQRRLLSVSLGNGGDKTLERKMRAQGNLVEYSPLFILLIAAAEMRAGTSITIWVLALTFLIARLFHGFALSFSSHSPKFRILGIGITFLAFMGAITTNVITMGISS